MLATQPRGLAPAMRNICPSCFVRLVSRVLRAIPTLHHAVAAGTRSLLGILVEKR